MYISTLSLDWFSPVLIQRASRPCWLHFIICRHMPSIVDTPVTGAPLCCCLPLCSHEPCLALTLDLVSPPLPTLSEPALRAPLHCRRGFLSYSDPGQAFSCRESCMLQWVAYPESPRLGRSFASPTDVVAPQILRYFGNAEDRRPCCLWPPGLL